VGTLAVHAILQGYLLLDFSHRWWQHYRKHNHSCDYPTRPWNAAEIILSLALIATMSFPDIQQIQFLRFLRLLRLFSILRIASTFISDLRVILLAVGNSFVCLCYLAFLLFMYFVYFAIAGVLLFQSSAPYYFKGEC
jgi:hypothetical protein